MKPTHESGVAMISALLITLLMAAVLVGFTAVVASDNRLRGLDDSRSEAFYTAHAGLEKLTADLGAVFFPNYAPTGAQIDALMAAPPALADVQWLAPDGSSGYRILYPADANGNPVATAHTVLSGPWQGFIGLVTPYTLSVTARQSDGSEASLTRTMQTVSIPVFQFGMFSETSLSFFAGPVFNFGGRVHTNADLFLTAGNSGGLTMSDKVTAVGEVIRKYLSNGWDNEDGSPSYKGPVNILKSPGSYRDLKLNEGSLVGTLGSAQNEPKWTNLSTGTYNYNIRNGRTGARPLALPIANFGAKPVDLVRRPPVNEDNTNPNVYQQRYFGQVSLRILLSDNAADITSLPTIVTGTPPVMLGNLATNPIAGYTVDANHPPLAVSSGIGADGYLTPADTPLVGGYLKIEKQDNAGVWTDVTLEVLNLGIAGKSLAANGGACAEPNPNAIIRFQRLRDAPVNGTLPCGTGSTVATDYWPNVIYDPREGAFREGIPAAADMSPRLGGVMHYLEIDVRNLSRWFQGVIGVSGISANDVTGYSVYISDRRGNHNAAGQETGEYGFEDFVNPNDANGTPDGALNTGEDINNNSQLDTYGQSPAVVPAGATAPMDVNARPWTQVTAVQARTNPALLFRRAVKLTNGALGNIVSPGLTITTENPVYIQGNWNADNAGFGDPHRATAVIADAVTLLSNAWTDLVSWNSPHNASGRVATTTWYRLAIIAGKPMSFPMPAVGAVPQDFGTDGGAHNFLRYVERWSGQTLNYRGAIATLYYSLQGVGTYKCCGTVYSPPTRAYIFDTDFLTPSLLPPRTPMFRDVNSTGFTYVIRPR